MTCWRRLHRWTSAGVFDQLHQILLQRLNAANRIDWSRAAMDGSHIDARKGGAGTGPSPVDLGKPGSKHHRICDGDATPIYVLTSGANVPDISRALDLLDCYPPIAGRPGRPRRWFAALLADRAYSSEAFRQACLERGTGPIIPKPKTPGIKGLGKLRYVVEQSFALLHQFLRLAVRRNAASTSTTASSTRLRHALLVPLDQMDRLTVTVSSRHEWARRKFAADDRTPSAARRGCPGR